MNNKKHISIKAIHTASQRLCGMLMTLCFVFIGIINTSCEREPVLNLHRGGSNITMDMPAIDLDLKVLWDYLFDYETEYDWQAEWYYGWDDTDIELFGPIGYNDPHAFDIRRYFTGNIQYGSHNAPYKHYIEGSHLSAQYDFGFWDILAWNDIQTDDGVQSIHIDEDDSYDYVTAYTGQSMMPSRYNAPRYTRAFYQPEHLFAGYEQGIEINSSLEGFTFDEQRQCWVRQLNMKLQPVTYIYLVQVILHNNKYNDGKKVTSIDGNADLSGMSRSVTLNSGITGPDAITVNYNMRMKNDLTGKNNEKVDIIGGKLITFGIPNLNPYKLSTRAYAESLAKVKEVDKDNHHYVDVTMQFVNGTDSTLVFDVTDQVQRLYRGGVITIDLDMNKVPIPNRSGGSSFDAVVKDFEEKQWEFDM